MHMAKSVLCAGWTTVDLVGVLHTLLHALTARLPTASESTCEMKLRLPTMQGSYIPFIDNMVEPLIGNDRFGQL